MGSFQQTLADGTGWAFLAVFAAGFATSLTPCVYPMIPITVSIFGAGQKRSRGAAFLLATCYVLGIAATYTVLGLIAGLSGWAAGSLLASPWFVLPLSAVFLLLAASMFGLWEIRLPHALSNRLSLVGGKGFHGAFAMGLVGGILIAPCTGPVLAGLLTYIALTRNVWLGGSLLFTFALGIGVLFWVIALFSLRLPSGGRWMEVTRSALGIPMVVAALYFLQNVFTPLARYASGRWAFAAANATLIVIGLALGALHLSYERGRAIVALRKTLAIGAVALGILGLVNFATAPAAELPWVYREAVALERGRQQRKPVLIDFWAQWCAPCKEMEATVLAHPAVRRELSRFVLLKVDVTHDTEWDRALKQKYEARELPQLVLLDAHGRQRVRLGKVGDPDELLRALRAVR